MPQPRLKVLFAATAPIAVPSLIALSNVADIVGVLTAPDRASGRGLTLHESAIKSEAKKIGITSIIQPERLDTSARELVSELNADIMVVFAYGKIFGPKFLALFPMGSINLHPSSLPKYRGPSPLTTAILNGDNSFGISIQKVSLKVDEGDIVVSKDYPLDGKETSATLHDIAAKESAHLLSECWSNIESLLESATPQGESGISYCSMFSKDDGKIDWNSSAKIIEAKVRAYQPWPKAWTTYNGKKLFIYQAEYIESESFLGEVGSVIGVDLDRGIKVNCLEGILIIKELQIQAKKRMDWKVFYNGNKNIVNSQLGGIS